MQSRLTLAGRTRSRYFLRCAITGVGLALAAWSQPVAAQALSASDRAAMVLTTAKAAFNDLSYDVAAERFREFIRLGAGTKFDLAAARYGLGVCLIEGTTKDYKGAADMLQVPAGMAGFKDRAYALYYLGVAYRDQGEPVPLRKRQTQPG